ncbi:hypothetical protein ACFUN8_18805 [Streptomyces sp. NPDC057307]|uniref:hypothetical protein n=1 Tax=Streptomyces sp. NPDC057307 TaxID=3346096 RepID=UPI003639FC90
MTGDAATVRRAAALGGAAVDGGRAVTVVVNSFDEADEARQESTAKAVKALIARAPTRAD